MKLCAEGQLTFVRSALGMCAVATLMTACSTYFSDTEPIVRTGAPSPRNDCEALFAAELTDDLGTAETYPPSPAQDVVLRVFDACSADELLAANERFWFATGPMGGRLMAHVFFDGPDPDPAGHFEALCASAPFDSTRACRTRSSGT